MGFGLTVSQVVARASGVRCDGTHPIGSSPTRLQSRCHLSGTRKMSYPIDVASQVSSKLSAILDDLVKDPDIREPVTLGFVRARLAAGLLGVVEQDEQLHFNASRTVLAELDALIERYTEEAPAIDFVTAKASEQLSRVIEALMNDPNTPQRPTLGAVRDAITHGIVGRLVGEGAIDTDQDEMLFDEIDELIERFGRDALAEELMRYE